MVSFAPPVQAMTAMRGSDPPTYILDHLGGAG